MDDAAIAEHLKQPPEQVRLALLYPELPQPIPFWDAVPHGPWSEHELHPPELRGCYFISFLIDAQYRSYAVAEHHHRIAEEYEDAVERQDEADAACAAARWERRTDDDSLAFGSGAEHVPPDGKLMPRQEEFCRYYAAQPVATRAAILAGYAEENAASYGSRLLRNPLVLDRIATLRREKGIRYVLERDTVHDKLEAVFFEALGERNHAAAVAALRLQADLADMLPRAARGKAKKSQGERAKKPIKAKVEKPRKAKVEAREKPGKANESH